MGRNKRSRSTSSSSSESEYIRRKIKRLQHRLERRKSRSSSRDSRRKSRASSSSSSRSASPDQKRNFHAEVDNSFVDCNSVVNSEVADPLQTELDERVLVAMGASKSKKSPIGEPFNQILANQCTTILKEGLQEERLKEIMSKYLIPENCPMIQAPRLNPEIKAAINDAGRKRDDRLLERQKEVGAALTAVGKAESILLKMPDKDDSALSLIEQLSDASAILGKIHHTDSEYRRSSILSLSLNQNNLQPHFKEALSDAPLDSFLFGEDLGERLKNAKALGRSVADLKAGPSKPRPLQQKDLNTAGPLRPKKFKQQHRSGPSRSNQSYRNFKGEKRRDQGDKWRYYARKNNK